MKLRKLIRIKKQELNENKYVFIVYFKGIDIINTTDKLTFEELHQIIGLSLLDKEIIKHHLYDNKYFVIRLKG